MNQHHSNSCPVCQSSDVTTEAMIQPNELEHIYRKRHDIQTELGTEPIAALSCCQCSLEWFDPMLAGGAEFYDQLQDDTGYYQPEKSEYARARDAIPAGGLVLDVGCGAGRFGLTLPSGSNYVGLDQSPRAAAAAQQAGLDVRLETIENHVLDPDNIGRYDTVCSFQVLEHVPEPIAFLDGCRRATKPNGRVVVSVPNNASYLGLAVNSALNMPPHHLTRWTQQSLATAGTAVGLCVESFTAEPLEEPNRSSCADAMGYHLLSRALPPLRTRRVVPLFASRLGSIPLKLASVPFRVVLGRPEFQPLGHSITAVYTVAK